MCKIIRKNRRFVDDVALSWISSRFSSIFVGISKLIKRCFISSFIFVFYFQSLTLDFSFCDCLFITILSSRLLSIDLMLALSLSLSSQALSNGITLLSSFLFINFFSIHLVHPKQKRLLQWTDFQYSTHCHFLCVSEYEIFKLNYHKKS